MFLNELNKMYDSFVANLYFLAPIIVFLMVFDIFIVKFVLKNDVVVKDKYLDIHKNRSIVWLTFLKVIVATYFLWQCIIINPYRPLDTPIFVLFYSYVLVNLFLKIMRQSKRFRKR